VVVFVNVVRVPGAFTSVFRTVVIVLPALPVVLLVVVREAVICLLAVSLICFSVSAAFGVGLVVGGFDRAGAVAGLGFGAALVGAFGEVTVVVLTNVLLVAVTVDEERLDLAVELVLVLTKVVGLVVVCRTVVDLAGAVAGLAAPVAVLLSVLVGLNLLGTDLVVVLLAAVIGAFLATAGLMSPFVNGFFSADLAAVRLVFGFGDGLVAAALGAAGAVDVLVWLILLVAVVVVLVIGGLAAAGFAALVLVGDVAGLDGIFLAAVGVPAFDLAAGAFFCVVATAAAPMAVAAAATATTSATFSLFS